MKNDKLIGFLFALTMLSVILVFVWAKTQFQTGTRVTADYLNSIYYTDGGHIHDGVDGDGHAPLINATQIADGGVEGRNILDYTIETNDIADGGITTNNLADGSVSAAKLLDGGIEEKLGVFDGGAGGLEWRNQAFATTQYDFVSYTILNRVGSGGITDFPYLPTAPYAYGDAYHYITPRSGGAEKYTFFIGWRPPTASTITTAYVRLLYTCSKEDASSFTFYHYVRGGTSDGGAYTATTLGEFQAFPCAADVGGVDALNAYGWTNITTAAQAADSDDGVIFYYGYLSVAANDSNTHLALVGLEIKFTAAKE